MDDPYPAAQMLWYLAALAFFFLLQILSSLGQTAAVTCNDAKLQEQAEDGDKRAARLVRLTAKPNRFLSSLNGFHVLLYILSSFCLLVIGRGWGIVEGLALPTWAAALMWAMILMVFFFVFGLLGELIPKKIAGQKPELAYGLSWFLSLVCGVMRPFCAAQQGLSNGFLRLLGLNPQAGNEQVTEENILMMVDAGEETGVIEESQKEMINNIFAFDDICAEDVMCHRTDICAVDVQESLSKAVELAEQEGFSRLPVFEEDLDNILGILYVKDLLPYVGRRIPAESSVRDLMREAYFVPESKRCGDLFTELTEKRVQMAIVVDEYGGTAGLVTLEDLVESIVGNIQDEYDDETEEIRQISETAFDIDGTTDLEEVEEILNTELPQGDYDTLGGMIMSMLGRVPADGEQPVVAAAGYRFQVLQIEDHRIERVHVERLLEAADESEEK